MKIHPVDRTSMYGIRRNRQETLHNIEEVVCKTYPIKDKFLEVYTALNKNKEKVYKLYYLKDIVGKWMKSKLVYFENNKRNYITRSERRS